MPRAWRELAERAVQANEPALWPAGIDPLQVFAVARTALKLAGEETARQSADEEGAGLDAVQRALVTLREAIERSPLPRGQATMYTLSGAELPDIKCLIGWRNVSDHLPAYSMSIVDILGIAEEKLQEHRTHLPERTVKRHRERPAAVAFVRWLDRAAKRRGMSLSATTLARWAEVAVGEALTPRDVRVILAPRGELKTPNRSR
jgi:hypothetical protein